ncbi:transposase, partial [Neisseria weaveri]
RYVRDNGGRPAYPLLSMFKAILLGQWHSLSDPELEYSLINILIIRHLSFG